MIAMIMIQQVEMDVVQAVKLRTVGTVLEVQLQHMMFAMKYVETNMTISNLNVTMVIPQAEMVAVQVVK